MLNWLILGGGIHGTHLSLILTTQAGVSPDAVRVLDPHDTPLALWSRFAENTGMEFLRSPHANNLHYDPFSLRTFALTRAGQPYAAFTEPYARPSLSLFQRHTEHLIKRHQLDRLRIRGRATGLHKVTNGWRILTTHGELQAQNIILAVGSGEAPYYPDWARSLQAEGAPVYHVFDPSFDRGQLRSWSQAVVIGGGISAAQTALALSQQGQGEVTLLMRRPVRVEAFDSDPCWATRLCQDRLHVDTDYVRRRSIIKKARNTGTLSQDVAHQLQKAVTHGQIERRLGEVASAVHAPDGWISLYPENADRPLRTDCLILATGFDPRRPGGEWLDRAIEAYRLPCAPCGYPIVNSSLCWEKGLFVTGPLAELEIGPAARNIIGARLAGQRIRRAVD